MNYWRAHTATIRCNGLSYMTIAAIKSLGISCKYLSKDLNTNAILMRSNSTWVKDTND